VADFCKDLPALDPTPMIQQLAVIVDNAYTIENPVPSKKDIEELLSVAEVMLS
jgi:hypothetical protein